jgi:5'-nucleotidase (lipoprotein e(P4) family)
LAFTRYAAERGVTVFYVTNRSHTVEESTRRNLEKLGFPLDAGRDTLLTRGEREDWKDSDKAARRAEIASQFRILLLVGDNLGDFLTGEMASLAERAALAAKHQQNWGTRWIMLPNPQYGSWEGAIFGFDYGLTYEERLRMKYKALKTR